MSADLIVLTVTIAASLVLALRGFRSHRLNVSRTVLMAAIWIGIIAVVAVVMQRIAAQ